MSAMKSKALLVTVLLAATVVTQTPTTKASTPAGGRVILQTPFRGLDTRNSGVPTTGPVGLAGLSHVWVLDSTQPGTATIYPCGDPPGPNPSLLFDARELVYTTIASSSTQMCLNSTTPVDVVEDVLGTVTPSPSPAGLQYAALADPLAVFEGHTPEFDPFQSNAPPPVQVPFDLGVVPTSARAAVMLLESTNPTQNGFVRILECGSQSLSADAAWNNSRAVGIAYVPLKPGSAQLCFSDRGATTLRITVLGYLQDDGPDPMSLPPTLSYPVQDAAPPGLRAITPVRLVDTRQALGVLVASKLQAGTVLELKLGDHVADSTTAVALNVTVTEPDGEGFLTVFPCDQAVPKASNLNYVAGETVPNLVNTKLSITDTVCFFSNRTTHLVVDLMGTFERGGGAGAQSVTPVRLLDTRKPIGVPSIGKLNAGQTLVLQVADRGGVPAADVAAATLNVTATEPDFAGFVTAYPCDRDRPTASNLNFVAGQTVPNLVTARLSATGTLCLFTSASTHLVADIAAWYSVGATQGYHELAPQRILDTREPIGVATAGKLLGGQTLTLQVADRGGVPGSGALAVTMNVTVTEPDTAGFVTIYPCDADRPEASNLNFTAGETVPNLVTVRLSTAGTVCLFAQRTTHLVADVAGYFTDVPEALRVGTVVPQS